MKKTLLLSLTLIAALLANGAMANPEEEKAAAVKTPVQQRGKANPPARPSKPKQESVAKTLKF
jgi:hypothetical protein